MSTEVKTLLIQVLVAFFEQLLEVLRKWFQTHIQEVVS